MTKNTRFKDYIVADREQSRRYFVHFIILTLAMEGLEPISWLYKYFINSKINSELTLFDRLQIILYIHRKFKGAKMYTISKIVLRPLTY